MLSNITENFDVLGVINETFTRSGIPMFWCTESNFIIVNDSFIKLTGYTKIELQEKSFNNITSTQTKQLLLEEIFTSKKREFKIITWALDTKEDKKVSLELRLTQFFIDRKRYYYGVVRNLSSKLPQTPIFIENEERLQLALQASEQGLWDWNTAADETFYSKEYYEMLGFENNAFVANYESWAERLHPDDIDTALAVWEDFINTNKDFYTSEFRMRKKDGSYLWVCSQGKVIYKDKNSIPIRVIGIIKNINTKKIAELNTLVQTQKLIDYAFFNSHQLRAPLSSILGLTELLKHEYSAEIVSSLEKVSKQLDEKVHEINKILIGDSFNYKKLQNSAIKKISLVDNDKILHVVYKKTIERYGNNIEITAYERAKQILELLNNKTLNTDLILLDIDSAFNVWDFLDEFTKTESPIPIYLLAKNIAFADTIKATNYNCIKGILLKPVDKQAFENLIKQSSN